MQNPNRFSVRIWISPTEKGIISVQNCSEICCYRNPRISPQISAADSPMCEHTPTLLFRHGYRNIICPPYIIIIHILYDCTPYGQTLTEGAAQGAMRTPVPLLGLPPYNISTFKKN